MKLNCRSISVKWINFQSFKVKIVALIFNILHTELNCRFNEMFTYKFNLVNK